ncbi:hypothetical protein DSM106972_063580 [Dulcicalothrix desertica PCC 7102]|uniref:PEP-CTERM protein-sorting domain-containing protein n=1 Tax=Dulcicalothrix desertica PCC 7102 TaxID=232991 RepID=A0A3S1CFG2_9CYAN|nr:hypothetical protein [Dulcicalothrix desertica]RUT01735.1 hypothetical protein DSM106972_063580 [Dulcicalothrix desertica PCC 7102]TWH42886.1 hypothetical protein CAL7102_06569 [Dulcicalothrix desertica PCC 7102]
MKLNQKIAVTTSGVALGFAAIKVSPVYAITRTVDFTITDVTQTAAYGGPPLVIEQPLSGFYSFDDQSTPVVVPPASLNLSLFPLTDFGFNLNGRQFSIEDISGYGGTATDLFISGSKAEGNNVVTNFSIFAIPRPGFAEPRFNGFAQRGSFLYSLEGKPQLQVRTTPVSVAEPATLASICIFGLTTIFIKRKIASNN